MFSHGRRFFTRYSYFKNNNITKCFYRSCQSMQNAQNQVTSQPITNRNDPALFSSDLFHRVLQRFPKGSSSDKDYDWPLAFAYGSGVFKQEGNISRGNMIDFVLVVENCDDWHTKNLIMNPKDYSALMSMLGGKNLAYIQDKIRANCYFNAFVPFEEGQIKYGVISRSNLMSDCLDWETLYIGGRMHKPVKIIQKADKKQDPDLHLALRMNLKNALHTSLLMLPEKFPERMLYDTICGLSYSGDFRMTIGEDKDKVRKIVDGSIMELKDLYRAQLKKMSDVSNPYTYLHAPSLNSVNAPADVMYEQDMSPGARHYHLTMLPKNMQESLVKLWNKDGKWKDVEDVLRSAAYDRDIDDLIGQCLPCIVRNPALVQAVKGVVTQGPYKSILYSSKKLVKMYKSLK